MTTNNPTTNREQKIPNPNDEKQPQNHESRPPDQPFPPEGWHLGRVISGSRGVLTIKMNPNYPNERPRLLYHNLDRDSDQNFHRFCPVMFKLDDLCDRIVELKEDDNKERMDQYFGIPAVLTSHNTNGAVLLKAARLDGIGLGFDKNPIKTYPSRLIDRDLPPENSRVLMWGVITDRTRPTIDGKIPRLEGYIDIVKITPDTTKLLREEEGILHPSLYNTLKQLHGINLEIGATALSQRLDSHGALQAATAESRSLATILARYKERATKTADNKDATDEQRQQARAILRLFNSPTPAIKILIKPRKHLQLNIKDINNELQSDHRLRRYIHRIFLILPADVNTSPTNPYHHNPHIIKDIHASHNNFIHHIYHIDKITHEGTYQEHTGSITHTRAMHARTYNLFEFHNTPLPERTNDLQTVTLPTPRHLTISDDEVVEDDDASIPYPARDTDHITVTCPPNNNTRNTLADNTLAKAVTGHKNTMISIDYNPPLEDWRTWNITTTPGQRGPLIYDLKISNALLFAMWEDDFRKGADENYLLIAKPEALKSPEAITALHSLAFSDDPQNDYDGPPPCARVCGPDAVSIKSDLGLKAIIDQLTRCKEAMKASFPFLCLQHASKTHLHYFATPPTKRPPNTQTTPTPGQAYQQGRHAELVIDLNPYMKTPRDQQAALDAVFEHYGIPRYAREKAKWAYSKAGHRGIYLGPLSCLYLEATPMPSATLSIFRKMDYPKVTNVRVKNNSDTLANQQLLRASRAQAAVRTPDRAATNLITLARKLSATAIKDRRGQQSMTDDRKADGKEKEHDDAESEGKGEAAKGADTAADTRDQDETAANKETHDTASSDANAKKRDAQEGGHPPQNKNPQNAGPAHNTLARPQQQTQPPALASIPEHTNNSSNNTQRQQHTSSNPTLTPYRKPTPPPPNQQQAGLKAANPADNDDVEEERDGKEEEEEEDRQNDMKDDEGIGLGLDLTAQLEKAADQAAEAADMEVEELERELADKANRVGKPQSPDPLEGLTQDDPPPDNGNDDATETNETTNATPTRQTTLGQFLSPPAATPGKARRQKNNQRAHPYGATANKSPPNEAGINNG